MASSRRYMTDGRPSTNAVYVTPFDHPRPIRPPDTYTSTPRSPTLYETKPISRRIYPPDERNPGSAISRTEYAVRPRTDSYISGDRRPSSVYIDKASARDRPVIVTAPRPRSPPYTSREESNRYLQPAVTHGRQHHQRHNSATKADMDRLPMSPRLVQYRPELPRPGPPQYSSKVYAAPAPPPRHPEDDFSYTGPREQFARDYPAAPPPQRRGSVTRRDRPVSIMSPADLTDPRTKPYNRRDMGPPPSAARQLERLDRDSGSGPRRNYDSDSDYGSERPKRRHSTRVPVVHQQREDGYGSARDDQAVRRPSEYRRERHDDRERPEEKERPVKTKPREYERESNRERDEYSISEKQRGDDRSDHHDRHRRHHDNRHEPRSRDSSPETSKFGKTLGALGLGGVVAGLGTKVLKDSRNKDESSDDQQEKSEKRRRRRHKDRDVDEDASKVDQDTYNGEKPSRRRRHEEEEPRHNAERPEALETPSSDEPRERRRHRRRKQKDEDTSVAEAEGFVPERQLEMVPPEHAEHVSDVEVYNRLPRGYEDQPPLESEDRGFEQRTLSPGENEDDRPRRVQLVEPTREKEEPKPRSILKQPTPAFPEDPNPTREGAAPLKDLTKDGVPQGARWTKISRRLVNPDALEKVNERFEERDDYVVVLRVVSREEIMKLAEITKEIREAREKKWQEEAQERRERRDGPHRDRNGPDFDDDKEHERPPLAIEQPQAPPAPFDPRLAQQQDPLGRSLPPSLPIPAINVNAPAYSNNV